MHKTDLFHLFFLQIRRGVVVITTRQLQSTKPELRFCTGSNPTRGVSEIGDGEDLWQWSRLEIRLTAFRRSTIPEKQFFIIIIQSVLESWNQTGHTYFRPCSPQKFSITLRRFVPGCKKSVNSISSFLRLTFSSCEFVSTCKKWGCRNTISG